MITIGDNVLCIKKGNWRVVELHETVSGPKYNEVYKVLDMFTDTDGTFINVNGYPYYCDEIGRAHV